MEATERSISAQMMTSVRPAAMMPMLADWSRMFIMFETVKKFSAVMERKTINKMSAKVEAVLGKARRDERGDAVSPTRTGGGASPDIRFHLIAHRFSPPLPHASYAAVLVA